MDDDDEILDWGEDPETEGSESDEESSLPTDDEDEPLGVPEENAEREIEGDFDRLVKSIRVQDGPTSSANLLAKEWDFNIEEKEAEFKDDLRAASGIGRKRNKAGRRSGPALSQQVKSLIGDGNQAYVDNDLPEAIRVMQEVIRIEPRAAAAWLVLAQCYEDMHENEKALQLRIMAAHLRHDAEEWDRLARQSREEGHNQQALYCYRKVYSLDPTNVDALWDRASLAKEMGEFRTARNAYFAILRRFPHDFTVLRELHPTLVELNELNTCAGLFQAALDHYVSIYPSGQGTGGVVGMDLLLLSDLYNVLGEHQRAVQVIRHGTRWLQGRLHQKYWEMCDDDREFDLEGSPPRPSVGEGTQVPSGHYELDTNARHRLAVARIKMGDVEEGKLHANVILAEDVLDYSVLFAEIADAYFEKELFAEAKPIYELLGGDPATSSIYILMRTAACMRNIDELREAAEVYEHIRLADPANNEAKMKLAEIYEITNETRRALDLVYEVIDSRKKRKTSSNAVTDERGQPVAPSLFAEDKGVIKTKSSARQNRLTNAQIKELEIQKEKGVVRNYKRLKELWPEMLAGEEMADREWMVEAEKLVDMFRETRNLFLTSRSNPFRGMLPPSRKKKRQDTEADADNMASRLQLDLERDSLAKKSARSGEKVEAVNFFRGVSFDDWLRLFMQYCFNLTKRDQYVIADEILRHIIVSNAYQAREHQDSIRLALITCAIHAGRHDIVVEQCRKLITHHQFNNEPLRILLASLASGLHNTDAYIMSTLQKHLFREMKLSDAAVKNPNGLKWNPLNKRYAPKSGGGGGGKAAANVDEVEGEEEEEDEEEIEGGGGGGGGRRGGGGLVVVEDEPEPSNSMVNDEKTSTSTSTSAPPLPAKENPLIIAMYGQICIAAKSYQSAIFYLLHAYDYSPTDPMICLCLAIASIGRAMQRQSDNRHHLVIQAMAFLSHYRKLRVGKGKSINSSTNNDNDNDNLGMREVEFNFGRTFHQLGLYTHAVKHYERVLELTESSSSSGDNLFACEAAYNLAQIFVFTGATPLADALYRRWLSI